MIKIFLDDVRSTPEGYVRTYTAEETIEMIKRHDGNIRCVSLDNDLGIGYTEGREVMKWIEEQAHEGTIKPIFQLIIHSANPVAQDEMKAARLNAYRFWEKQGYDIFQ